MKPQFLIAAPHSGAGKTTVTLGIIRALHNRRLAIQSFKCGPDYLDPKLHTIASGKTGINLDRFMMDDAHISSVYNAYGNDADVLITEGVMGLFDGSVKMEGSSADLAGFLNIPVVLIVNAKAMAYSVAALLLGFKLLRKDIHIAGVIFNFVERESHYQLLKAAAEDVGIRALGFLPKNEGMQIPSRHLGLKTGSEIDHEVIIEQAAEHIQKHIDLDELMRITAAPFFPSSFPLPLIAKGQRKILIARDEAFNFLYAENIRILAGLGQVSYFSPLKDTVLPAADLIYLPGGYPELHLGTLSANTALKQQLVSYYEHGGKFLAECGGMMYLGQYIADEEGRQFPMTGILDVSTSMQQKKLSLGYKRMLIGGTELRGHEFHYSHFTEIPPQEQDIQVWNARDEALQTPVFKTDQVLASYLHFYFGNRAAAIEKLLFG
ncbi:cobyrinic acid a,c-diamide synthase [Pedobacter westerhofensis]|uniref:Cobyrinate a,c-diamide synthase n=1 Tax=Pedobacter westerhofensis TaxID=425512 RepID=A0A521C0Q5_9SPHI|nr:cobyrinate a,c-diamide synthase [Pedobacter westerhofensis]SMO52964.1 cobyrinic acid a,c-diamide synthase [Pedobacter westerhofensis]